MVNRQLSSNVQCTKLYKGFPRELHAVQSGSHCPDEESDPNFKMTNSSDMTLGCTLLFVHFSSSISKQI